MGGTRKGVGAYLSFSLRGGRWGSVVVREREQWDTKGPGSTLGCDLLSF